MKNIFILPTDKQSEEVWKDVKEDFIQFKKK